MRDIGADIARLNDQASAAAEQQKDLLLGLPIAHRMRRLGMAPSDNPCFAPAGESAAAEPLDKGRSGEAEAFD